MKSVLLLGAGGFLASNLLYGLSKNPDVHIIAISRKALRFSETKVIEAYSAESLRQMLGTLNPAAVVNCVGMVGHERVDSEPEQARTVNSLLPGDFARVCDEFGVQFVHFSTDAVYSSLPEDAPHSERDNAAPFSMYGKTKLEGEFRALDSNPKTCVLRINFFGHSKSGRQGILDYFRSGLSRGDEVLAYGRYSASSIYAGNLADVLAKIIVGPVSGIFNLGSRDSMTKLEFGELVLDFLPGCGGSLIDVDPSSWSSTGTIARDLTMDVSKIEQTLKIQLPTQGAGLHRAFKELDGFHSAFEI